MPTNLLHIPLVSRYILPCLLLLLFASVACAETEDERFLAGLRVRRLFQVAEAYCTDRLADPKLDDNHRATLVIEMMITLSQHAIYSPPQEREKLWQQARQAADRIPVEHPRKVLVSLQAALLTLAQGELARQEAEAANAAPQEYAAAQKLLREATSELEQLDKQLAQQIAVRRQPAKGELTVDELFALQHNVRYQLARARRNQALCYPAGSNDRVAALGQALEQLDKLRVLLAENEALADRIKIDQGLCLRLLENYGAAARVLSGLLTAETPAAIQQQARAELARVELANQRPEAALRLIEAGKLSAASASPELEFALLEAYVALWKGAGQSPEAARHRQQAVDQLALLERQFGVYWGRRGQWLVLGAAGRGDENLEILVRAADARFLKGQFDDETLKIYDQASATALAAGDLQKYLELGYRAASVQERAGRTPDAATRLQKLATEVADRLTPDDPLFPKTATIHLHGIRLFLQTDQAGQPPGDDQIAELYIEHLNTWPQQASANDARLGLGLIYERQEKWLEALEAHQAVEPGHARFLPALEGAARTWPKYLATLAEQPQQDAVRQAVRYFQSVLAPPGQTLPEAFDDSQRLAALAAARLLLQYGSQGHAEAENLLRAALAGSPDAPAPFTSAARSLLVVALAGQPEKRRDAQQLIAQLGADAPQQLLETLQGLTSLAASAREDVRRDLAALQLQAIQQLEPQLSKLEPAQRVALARVEAEALAASGQRREAISAYEKLIKDQPQNGAVREGYAMLLAAASDPAALRQALDQWRILAQGSRPQTDRWWRAKYQVALLNYQLGDKDQAARLIRYLQVTPPGLENSPLKREFLELLGRAEGGQN